MSAYYRIQFPHPIADVYVNELRTSINQATAVNSTSEVAQEVVASTFPAREEVAVLSTTGDVIEAKNHIDTPDVPLRPSEKKRLHWKGKTC